MRSLMDQAVRENRTVTVRETNWPLADGTPRWLSAQAVPLSDSSGPLGVKVVFTDTTAFKTLQADLQASHSEIETAYEEIQSTNEELETTNEELNSAVEELETTNEELQSTNEELETINEELHSSNEELETVNATLRARTDEVDRINRYAEAIMASLSLGAVVLNRNLEVQLWSAVSEDQWGVRSEEVRGKHFLSLDIGLPVDALMPAIRQSLASGKSARAEVPAVNRRGRNINCTVSIRPFHNGQEEPSDGLILLVETNEPAR